jgi:hypothetical protein
MTTYEHYEALVAAVLQNRPVQHTPEPSIHQIPGCCPMYKGKTKPLCYNPPGPNNMACASCLKKWKTQQCNIAYPLAKVMSDLKIDTKTKAHIRKTLFEPQLRCFLPQKTQIEEIDTDFLFDGEKEEEENQSSNSDLDSLFESLDVDTTKLKAQEYEIRLEDQHRKYTADVEAHRIKFETQKTALILKHAADLETQKTIFVAKHAANLNTQKQKFMAVLDTQLKIQKCKLVTDFKASILAAKTRKTFKASKTGALCIKIIKQ